MPIPSLQGSSDGAIDLTQSPSSPLYAPAPDPLSSLPSDLEIGGKDVVHLQSESSIQFQDEILQPRIMLAPLQHFSVDGVRHSVFLDSTYPSRHLVAQFMHENMQTSGLPGPNFVSIQACNQLCVPPLMPRYDIPMNDQDVVLKRLVSVVCGDVLRTVNSCGNITVTKIAYCCSVLRLVLQLQSHALLTTLRKRALVQLFLFAPRLQYCFNLVPVKKTFILGAFLVLC